MASSRSSFFSQRRKWLLRFVIFIVIPPRWLIIVGLETCLEEFPIHAFLEGHLCDFLLPAFIGFGIHPFLMSLFRFQHLEAFLMLTIGNCGKQQSRNHTEQEKQSFCHIC